MSKRDVEEEGIHGSKVEGNGDRNIIANIQRGMLKTSDGILELYDQELGRASQSLRQSGGNRARMEEEAQN